MRENLILVPDSGNPTFRVPISDLARAVDLGEPESDQNVRRLIRGVKPKASAEEIERVIADIKASGEENSDIVAIGAWDNENLCGLGIGEKIDDTVYVTGLVLNPARQNSADRAQLIFAGMKRKADAQRVAVVCGEQDERFFSELFRSEPIRFEDEDGDNVAVFVADMED